MKTESPSFSEFISSPSSKYNNRFDVRGHKYVFGPTQMSSMEGKKHIYAQEHQLNYYNNNFKGHIFEQKLLISLKSGHLK